MPTKTGSQSLNKRHKRMALSQKVDERVRDYRQVECVICGRMFADAETRHRHCLMEHTDGERPYKCRVCWKSFLFFDQCNEHQIKLHGFSAKQHQAPTVEYNGTA